MCEAPPEHNSDMCRRCNAKWRAARAAEEKGISYYPTLQILYTSPPPHSGTAAQCFSAHRKVGELNEDEEPAQCAVRAQGAILSEFINLDRPAAGQRRRRRAERGNAATARCYTTTLTLHVCRVHCYTVQWTKHLYGSHSIQESPRCARHNCTQKSSSESGACERRRARVSCRRRV